MNPVAPWLHDRPVRNLNPGDLRPRSGPPAWPGQDEVDGGPGGPFSVFLTASDGWAALGLWCLDARYLRGMKTARQMIDVFAPPTENDTAEYAAGVVARMGSEDLDLANTATLQQLCTAIAHWEESHPAWPEVLITSGMQLCVARWPTFRAARLAPAPAPASPPAETSAQLNQQELNKIDNPSPPEAA
jgi:hypothetical protein